MRRRSDDAARCAMLDAQRYIRPTNEKGEREGERRAGAKQNQRAVERTSSRRPKRDLNQGAACPGSFFAYFAYFLRAAHAHQHTHTQARAPPPLVRASVLLLARSSLPLHFAHTPTTLDSRPPPDLLPTSSLLSAGVYCTATDSSRRLRLPTCPLSVRSCIPPAATPPQAHRRRTRLLSLSLSVCLSHTRTLPPQLLESLACYSVLLPHGGG